MGIHKADRRREGQRRNGILRRRRGCFDKERFESTQRDERHREDRRSKDKGEDFKLQDQDRTRARWGFRTAIRGKIRHCRCEAGESQEGFCTSMRQHVKLHASKRTVNHEGPFEGTKTITGSKYTHILKYKKQWKFKECERQVGIQGKEGEWHTGRDTCEATRCDALTKYSSRI